MSACTSERGSNPICSIGLKLAEPRGKMGMFRDQALRRVERVSRFGLITSAVMSVGMGSLYLWRSFTFNSETGDVTYVYDEILFGFGLMGLATSATWLWFSSKRLRVRRIFEALFWAAQIPHFAAFGIYYYVLASPSVSVLSYVSDSHIHWSTMFFLNPNFRISDTDPGRPDAFGVNFVAVTFFALCVWRAIQCRDSSAAGNSALPKPSG
jgi:hypothetical protein